MTRQTAAMGTHGIAFQAKSLLMPVTPGGCGVGLALGGATVSGQNTLYAYLPFSVSLMGDRLALHQNLGWVHGGQTAPADAMTWALAGQVRLSDRVEWRAEAYGDTRSQPSYQTGLRWWLWPERLQLDGIFGLTSGPGGWCVIGLNIYPPAWAAMPAAPGLVLHAARARRG
ncbi:MAG TPA: hypothetical protein V6D05_02565 [Stenomitos sp.]